MTDTVALYELCEQLFQQETFKGVSIVKKGELEHTIWFEDSASGNYFSILKRLQSRLHAHLFIKEMDKEPGDDFFYQYIVLEVAGDASSFQSVGVGDHPEVAAGRSHQERYVQDGLLERLAQATPFPSFTHPYWGVTQQGQLAEILSFVEGKTADERGHAPYYYHFTLQSFRSQLSHLFHNGRLILPALWYAIETGLVHNVSKEVWSGPLRWSGELGPGVIAVGNTLYAPPAVWEQYPSLSVAALQQWQKIT